MSEEYLEYTNNSRRKLELVECADEGCDPGPLHTYPIESGETIKLRKREGVRMRWRKYRPEGLK